MAPSDKHMKLTCLAGTWLANRVTRKGLRGTTEVAIDRGYVADFAALCSLQNRFFQAYCSYSHRSPRIYRLVVVDGTRRYEVAGTVENYLACVFEAKASRADFLSTFGPGSKHAKRREPVGSLHWCVTPRGMIVADELPEFWGLLEERGAGLREVRKPKINVLTDARVDEIAHKLLWPLQARRQTTTCENCGKWIHKHYCRRCSLKPAPEIVNNQ